MKEPAIGLIELKSVARGILVTDAIVKKAPVKLLETHPICPGKYMILFCGEVGDVEEAMSEGVRIAGDLLVNDLFLPQVHTGVVPALTGTSNISEFGAIGVLETFSIATCLKAADLAAKETPVGLVEIRLAQGLGGKGYFVMTGELHDLEASMKVAKDYVVREGTLACAEVIASPHPDLIEKGVYW